MAGIVALKATAGGSVQLKAEDALTTDRDIALHQDMFPVAFVVFEGSGETNGTIVTSFGVASLTPVSTGYYDVVFSTPMDNIAYGVLASSYGRACGVDLDTAQTVNGFRLRVDTVNGTGLSYSWGKTTIMVYGGKA